MNVTKIESGIIAEVKFVYVCHISLCNYALAYNLLGKENKEQQEIERIAEIDFNFEILNRMSTR